MQDTRFDVTVRHEDGTRSLEITQANKCVGTFGICANRNIRFVRRDV
jgi:hypothetical protein